MGSMPNDEPTASLESLLEDLEIAALVRERTAAGPPTPLIDLAVQLGLDPADFR